MDDQYLEEDPPDYEQYSQYEGTSESVPYVVVSLQPDGAAVVESIVGASHYEVVREKKDFVELFERVCIFCSILCFLFSYFTAAELLSKHSWFAFRPDWRT